MACLAFSRACAKTGKRIAARIAMIAITTRSSISVKAAPAWGADVIRPADRDGNEMCGMRLTFQRHRTSVRIVDDQIKTKVNESGYGITDYPFTLLRKC